MGKRYEWGKGGKERKKEGVEEGIEWKGDTAWPGPSLQFLDPPLAALSIAAVGRLD